MRVCQTKRRQCFVCFEGLLEITGAFVLKIHVKEVQELKSRINTECVTQKVHSLIAKLVQTKVKHFQMFVGSQCPTEALHVATFKSTPLKRQYFELTRTGKDLRQSICADFADEIEVESKDADAGRNWCIFLKLGSARLKVVVEQIE